MFFRLRAVNDNKEMESKGEIPIGGSLRLRKQSKLAQKGDLNAIKQLANATRHILDFDALLPTSSVQVPGHRHMDDLSKRPVMIATADEERKQFLSSQISTWF